MKKLKFPEEKWQVLVELCSNDPILIDETPPKTENRELHKSFAKMKPLKTIKCSFDILPPIAEEDEVDST